MGHRWTLAGLLCTAAAAASAQTELPCSAQLSPAQQARFRMLGLACDAARATPTAWQRLWRTGPQAAEADALVASEPVPMSVPAPRESQATATAAGRDTLESAHLRLFGGAGVTTARMGPSPVATTSTVSPGARASSRAATARAMQLAPQVDAVARRHNIDPLLLHAVAHVESRHDSAAVSSAGARGVMQVMPGTAARFGVAQPGALHQPGTNLEVSAAYLKTLQDRFGTNLPLVLAAYNAGEGAVEKHGRRIPPYAETQNYVRLVMAKYQLLTEAARVAKAQ